MNKSLIESLVLLVSIFLLALFCYFYYNSLFKKHYELRALKSDQCYPIIPDQGGCCLLPSGVVACSDIVE
jgi:hypothetical protein